MSIGELQEAWNSGSIDGFFEVTDRKISTWQEWDQIRNEDHTYG